MKTLWMTMLTLAFALSFSATVAHGQASMGGKAGLEKTVKTFFDFVKANDIDKVKSYYTADYTFVGPDGNLLTVEERIKVMKEGTGVRLQSADDIAVRTYGTTTGISTGIVTSTNPAGGSGKSRFTQVWIWQRSRWRLAASHVTPIQ
jgi:ketosteroid isomerase-like protein